MIGRRTSQPMPGGNGVVFDAIDRIAHTQTSRTIDLAGK
jgi:hypothetical protein